VIISQVFALYEHVDFFRCGVEARGGGS